MMLSIIMPVYNAAKYLDKCIDCIINQNSEDWELIIVDDGSTDESPKIIKHYAGSHKNIKTVFQQNMGPSAARNAGIDLAIGDIISFVDSDDFITPDYVSTILREIKNYDILFFGISKLFTDGKTIVCKPLEGASNDKNGIQQLLYRLLVNQEDCAYFGFMVNKAFRHNIIRQNNLKFDESLKIKEDELFVWNYCELVSSCKVLQKSLYNYQILNNSLSHSRNVYVNYSLLVDKISTATKWITQSCLRRVVDEQIFNYTTNAVVEAIRFNDVNSLSSARQKLMQYNDLSNTTFSLPLWFRIAKYMPRKVAYIYVYYYLVFYLWRSRL